MSDINPNDVDELAHAIAGSLGGAASIAVTYPLVTITTNLQTKENEGKPKLETIKEIYDKNGVSGYFWGLESAVYGMATTNFVYYYFYEWCAKTARTFTTKQYLSTWESILASTIAGSMTAIASNPIWVANTRMTVTKSSHSTVRTIVDIVKKDGPLTLLNGLKPALVLVSNPIIQYTVYEQLKNVVLKLQKRKVLSPSWAFLLGAIGKLAATGTTYPYITLKTRMHLMQHDKNHKQSMWALIVEIVRRDGISGLYNGVGVKLVQSIMTAAFLFFFKEGFIQWSLKVIKLLRVISMNRNKKHLSG
ncbi:unnamed protein product [Kluyveromyces dobzhanskii CBS 2104]|uniref:WGS project CCBQ000000000 data, contig 00106 n=1 Tax=Kluyveromyces dobzhanskii CBS 2104 TaxID=1427455 RepID=A0A0A8L7X1_9SACH|nr:unnamed protein product [Kluyveromyces dobzhanskii CBS 2104]